MGLYLHSLCKANWHSIAYPYTGLPRYDLSTAIAALTQSTVNLVWTGYPSLTTGSFPIIDPYAEDSRALLAQGTNDAIGSDSEESDSAEFEVDSCSIKEEDTKESSTLS